MNGTVTGSDKGKQDASQWKDIRDWLSCVDALGQLAHIEGADWNLEMGALAEIAFRETQSRPALLFDRIKDYPAGHRLLCNPVGSRDRLALTLGMPLGLSDLEFVDVWRHRLRSIRPLPCLAVTGGPLLENVETGEQVDLWKFPAPLWHQRDGGRYIGTGDLVITRDPDEGWVNGGTYRVMVHDRSTAGIYINPTGHGAVHIQKYFSRGEPCPVVICPGPDPLLFVAGCSRIAPGISELDYAGGIKGQPTEVIQGPVTGLPIPAHSEVAFEGEILPEYRDEGPFGEFHGYYASGSRPEPIVRIKAVYYRTNPIILGVPPLRPPCDNTFPQLYMRPALIWNELEAAGVPDVTGVWGHGGVSVFFIVVSIRQRYPGHAKQAGVMTAQCSAAVHMNRFVVVVDDDIDATDIEQVIWALSTRCDPGQDVDLLRRCASSPLDTVLTLTRENAHNSRMVIDACRPYERLKDFPAVISIAPELKASLAERYGAILGRR